MHLMTEAARVPAQPAGAAGGVLSMEVVDNSDRAQPVDIEFRQTSVSIIYQSWTGVVGRGRLRAWLLSPHGAITVGPVVFAETISGIALHLPDAVVWELSPTVHAAMLERV